MPDGVQIAQAPNFGHSGLVGCQPPQHVIESSRDIPHRGRDFASGRIPRFRSEDRLASDPVDIASA
jgi:hypothetical protein